MAEKPRTALVTGAARRLGRAIGFALASSGWSVVVHAHHSYQEAEEVVNQIVEQGGQAKVVHGSLTEKETSSVEVFEQASRLFGPLSCLVNNAAVFYHDRLATVTTKSWYEHFKMNCIAPMFLCQAFANYLAKDMTGNIVNLLDQKLLRLTPDFFSYTLSKSGLWTMTQMLAIELAPNIRVNGIAPGLVLRSGKQSEEQFLHTHKQTLLGVGPKVEDITRSLLFILDTPCLTGQMIILDGGRRFIADPYSDGVVY